jgi:hypothetical protein
MSNASYSEADEHGICVTLTSHVRMVLDPVKPNVSVAESDDDVPKSMYTAGE